MGEERERLACPPLLPASSGPFRARPRTTKTLSSPRGENEKTGADPRSGGGTKRRVLGRNEGRGGRWLSRQEASRL